jgi:hypothetical protein
MIVQRERFSFSSDGIRHGFGYFEMRVVTHVLEFYDPNPRRPPPDMFGNVRARASIGHAPDEMGRRIGSGRRLV